MARISELELSVGRVLLTAANNTRIRTVNLGSASDPNYQTSVTPLAPIPGMGAKVQVTSINTGGIQLRYLDETALCREEIINPQGEVTEKWYHEPSFPGLTFNVSQNYQYLEPLQ